MHKKLLLVPVLLLGSLSIYCTETVVTAARQGGDGGTDGALGPEGTAHADPVAFSAISEGTFTEQSNVITVEGAARITVAVSLGTQPPDTTPAPECRAVWVVPSGKLAATSFEGASANLYLPISNGHSDLMGPMPVVLPQIFIRCKNVTGPIDYVIYGIK